MNINVILKELTLEEKASLCSGSDSWHTQPIERLDIPAVMVADGPHGLRKVKETADMSNQEAIEAVCFPCACTTACSFDRELLSTMGKALGQSCRAEKVDILLGPGCNIKRSPLCGRNFEYFSEDPYLASQMAAAHIKGVQSMGVGTSLKHFACNNQETRRMSCSSNMDERTFFEIYAAAFEGAVKEAKPYTLMCSYNKLNNVFCSENTFTLTEVLRDKWGYNGLVMSDWGAVNDRPLGVKAGLDLEMPSSHGINDARIVEAVKNGTLDEKYLDKAVRNVLELVGKFENNSGDTAWDKQAQHELARKIARECAVLLKNKDSILPLDKNKKIAFIGDFAKVPRYQGSGSSHINSFRVTSALDAVKGICDVDYAKGYDSGTDEVNEQLINEAVECAKRNDIIVIFAGLTDIYESEGFDRKHMKMPQNQLDLIDKICGVCSDVVVVLHNGSPVEMPFESKVKGILEMYLGGQAVGGATCDLLFGDANPCGKLAETFPVKLSDNPSYLSFPGHLDDVDYKEGIFVGYRYYDFKQIEPLFPFGHGLSYTTFEYSDLKLSSNAISADDELTVSVVVKNTGDTDGKEVVQLYVSDKQSGVIRPIRELKGFEKISLKAGESKKIMFKLDRRAFAFYSTQAHDWIVEEGDFTVSLGSSSRDIRTSCDVYVSSNDTIPVHLTINSTIGDIVSIPQGRKKLESIAGKVSAEISSAQTDQTMGAAAQQMVEAMMWEMPIRAILSFTSKPIMTREELEAMINELNEEINSAT